MIRVGAVLVAAALAVAPAAAADVQGPEHGREVALVANAESGTVTVLDGRAFRVLRTLDVVPDGAEPSPLAGDPVVAPLNHFLITAAGGVNLAQDQDVSPDGRTLYVSRGHRGDVAAFDLRSGELRWKVAVPGLRADHMTIDDAGLRLYVSAMTANLILAIDTRTQEVVGTATAGQWPHDNHLSHDGKLLYNASIGTIILSEEMRQALSPPPYQLTVLDPATMRIQRTFAFDRGIRPTAFTDDGATMYAQRSLESSIMRVRLRDGHVERIAHLPVKAGTGEADYDFEAPHHGLALSPDEQSLCVAGRVSDYAAVVDARTLQPRHITAVADAPGWASITPDGRTCLLANNRDGTVSAVDLRSGEEVARVPTGAGPKHIAAARVPEDVVCVESTVPGCSGAISLLRRCLKDRRMRASLAGDTDTVLRVRFTAGRSSRVDRRPPYAVTLRAEGRRVLAEITTAGTPLRRSRSRPRCR